MTKQTKSLFERGLNSLVLDCSLIFRFDRRGFIELLFGVLLLGVLGALTPFAEVVGFSIHQGGSWDFGVLLLFDGLSFGACLSGKRVPAASAYVVVLLLGVYWAGVLGVLSPLLEVVGFFFHQGGSWDFGVLLLFGERAPPDMRGCFFGD